MAWACCEQGQQASGHSGRPLSPCHLLAAGLVAARLGDCDSLPVFQAELEIKISGGSGPVVRTWRFHPEGAGSIPGQGTEISEAVQQATPEQWKPLVC